MGVFGAMLRPFWGPWAPFWGLREPLGAILGVLAGVFEASDAILRCLGSVLDVLDAIVSIFGHFHYMLRVSPPAALASEASSVGERSEPRVACYSSLGEGGDRGDMLSRSVRSPTKVVH